MLVYSSQMLYKPSQLPRFLQRHAMVRPAFALAVMTLFLGVGDLHAQKTQKSIKEQLEFGVEMAQRGLWSEALFRFRAVEKVAPENSAVVNNLAVAHEALGLFEEALEYYRRAIELDPSNRSLKRNYSRFVEFYQGFKKPEDGETEEVQDPPESDDSTSTESGELPL